MMRDLLPGEEITVELIQQSTNLTDVSKEMVMSGIVGLALLGPSISHDTKPYAIVLTTSCTLYVIDPEDTRGIMFLKAKLIDKRIHYYLTNGLNEAACLYSNYNIDLNSSNINVDCCTGLHIHLMNMLKHAPMYTILTYPPLVQRAIRRQPSIEKFDNLVEIWLNVNRQLVVYEGSSLIHLKSRPLNSIATDIIKKRCILIRGLAQTLVDCSWLEVRQMSDSLFTSLTNCNSLIRREKVTQLLGRDETEKCDIELMAHLNQTLIV